MFLSVDLGLLLRLFSINFILSYPTSSAGAPTPRWIVASAGAELLQTARFEVTLTRRIVLPAAPKMFLRKSLLGSICSIAVVVASLASTEFN